MRAADGGAGAGDRLDHRRRGGQAPRRELEYHVAQSALERRRARPVPERHLGRHAESKGTWLNQVAQQNGWLDERGKVRNEARSTVLSLRYDPEASIRTIADFAKSNLDRLERNGVPARDSVTTIARAAYLSHQLGSGDAMRFLKGQIQPDRARMLLHAQVGSASAEQRIAAAGDASRAHRDWLLGYIDRHVQPDRFAA